MEPVELPPLVEHRGLRRVQVLGLAVPENPSAEADDPAAPIADREDDALPQPVVDLAVLVRDEPRLKQPLPSRGVPAQAGEQKVPAGWGVPKSVAAGDLAGQPPPLEIVDGPTRLRVGAQLLTIELGRLIQHLVQRALVGTRASRLPVGRHLEPGALGQLIHRLPEGQPIVLHQEADGGTVGATAEAMVELLLRADGEGGGALVVERATCLEVPARLAQGDALADQVDDVGTREELIDEAWGDSAGHGPKLAEDPHPGSRGGLRAVQAVSRRFTRALTAPMSARPWTWGRRIAMTLPMSLMAAAPVSPIAPVTRVSISDSDRAAGR